MTELSRKVLRQVGFLRDQRGIANRYVLEHDHWKVHLEKTKQFILRCMDNCHEGSATILGSGWWLDIPIDEMVEKFSPLRLIDISHPPEIRKKAEKYPDIQLIEADITGGLVLDIYHKIKERKKQRPALSDIPIHDFSPGFDPGLVISLNLLSQIDSVLTEFWTGYITEKEEDIMAFRKQIQQKHIDFLMHNPSCIITDTREIKNYPNQKVITRPTVVVPYPEGDISDQWVWDFDTSKTYDPSAITTLEVRAVCLI